MPEKRILLVIAVLMILTIVLANGLGNKFAIDNPQTSDGKEEADRQFTQTEQLCLELYDSCKEDEFPLELYVLKLLVKSIDASYEPEALKAQAVILRSWIGAGKWDEEELMEAAAGSVCHGKIAEENTEDAMANILQAVLDTRGIVIDRNGEIVCMSYHAMSSGATRSSDRAGGRSVLCSSNLAAKNYISKVEISGKRIGTLDEVRRDERGYVEWVRQNGEWVSGEKFRTENGEVLHKTGIHESSDVWTKKLKCRCGYKMRKNKWRKNKNGEVIYGYKCYNQLNYGSKDVRIEAGIDDSKSCKLREICDWKLEMMARHIFAGLWGNKKDILNNVSSLYQISVFQEYQKAAEIKATVDKEIAKLDEKLKRLTRMRLEDEIPKESYLELKKEIEQEKIELINKRRILDAGMVPNEDGEEEPAKKVEDFLLSKMDFTEHYVDREVIKQFVHTIVPVTETCFHWYMNFDLIDVPNDMKKLVWEFTIDYKSARSYRKEKDGMLRPNQWQDLTVKVFI